MECNGDYWASDDPKILFTIDSGASVTCIPRSEYKPSWGMLGTVNKSIFGPSGATLGKLSVVLKCNNKQCVAVVHFIDNLQRPLLGRPELRALDIVTVD